MRKIPTLFQRDPDDMRHVTQDVNPHAAWVLDGQARATRKFDGTCVRLATVSGWWARREVKPGKPPPTWYVPIETDPITGKTVGWEPIDQSAFITTFRMVRDVPTRPGTYELCGPKINGNPERYDDHVLVPHGEYSLGTVPLTYDGLASYLATVQYEGIVWHHPDGRMAKLKRRDIRLSQASER